jgi:hypothetical protein
MYKMKKPSFRIGGGCGSCGGCGTMTVVESAAFRTALVLLTCTALAVAMQDDVIDRLRTSKDRSGCIFKSAKLTFLYG